MQSRLSIATFVLLLPIALLLQGCDSGGSNAGIQNEFTLTIESNSSSDAAPEAASHGTVSGYSFFYAAEHPETGEEAFGVYLSDSESFSTESASQGLFGFVARASGQPGTGQYNFSSGSSLEASQFVGFLYENMSNVQAAPFYVINSGTLTLNESSDSKVSGSIDATATMYMFTGTETSQEEVTITGTFTAKDVETFVEFATPGV